MNQAPQDFGPQLKSKLLQYHQDKHAIKNDTRKKMAEIFFALHRETATTTHTQHRHQAPFQLKLKKKRPLWQEALIAGATTLSIWGVSHLGLNFPAYAQIAQFHADTLTASVIQKLEPKEAPKPQPLETTETTAETPTLNTHRLAQKTFSRLPVYPSDNRIVLPRIGKNVPLVSVPNNQNWYQLEENIQGGLRQGVVVHPISHKPGNFGNFFLTGHSSYYSWDPGRYKDVFALLHELKEGDIVEVYWEGKQHRYRLRQQRVVPPTETSVLNQPADESIITLMTCTPVGTNKNRLIWVGDLID